MIDVLQCAEELMDALIELKMDLDLEKDKYNTFVEFICLPTDQVDINTTIFEESEQLMQGSWLKLARKAPNLD